MRQSLPPRQRHNSPVTRSRASGRLRAQRTQLSQRVGRTHPRSPAQLIWQLWSTTAKILRMEREVAQQKNVRRDAVSSWSRQALQSKPPQQGRTTTVYRVVRTLAPKQDRAKLQIRDSEGNLQGPAAECRSLLAHFRDTYQASLAQLSCVSPCRASLLDSESCAAALASLPALKAVHPAAAPRCTLEIRSFANGRSPEPLFEPSLRFASSEAASRDSTGCNVLGAQARQEGSTTGRRQTDQSAAPGQQGPCPSAHTAARPLPSAVHSERPAICILSRPLRDGSIAQSCFSFPRVPRSSSCPSHNGSTTPVMASLEPPVSGDSLFPSTLLRPSIRSRGG